MSICKKIYGFMLNTLSKNIGIDLAKKIDSKIRFNRNIDVNNPKTLADKVSYIELFCQDKRASDCTDKYLVREYIRQKGLQEILIPIVGGPWNCVEEVSLEQIPIPFVLKATHGCKMNYIVNADNDLDPRKCFKEMRRWMNTTYGTYSLEKHYEKIQHRIYAEQCLPDLDSLVDYKFHCCNGEPIFILAVSNRKINRDGKMEYGVNVYDLEWNEIEDAVVPNKRGVRKLKKPALLAEMTDVARTLSEDFLFVRVDLYERREKILFGELTFSPACGVFPNFTEKFLERMGEKLVIEK